MPIWLTVDTHSGVPIYLQLVDQVKHALEVGALQAGEQLPTVRQLASDLTLAPNTIVKAYNELQRMRLIDSRPGSGTVVTANLDGTLRRQQTEAVFARLQSLVRDAAGLGVALPDLAARFQAAAEQVYGDPKKEGPG